MNKLLLLKILIFHFQPFLNKIFLSICVVNYFKEYLAFVAAVTMYCTTADLADSFESFLADLQLTIITFLDIEKKQPKILICRDKACRRIICYARFI